MRFVTKLGVIVLLSVLVAACGGDDKKGGGLLGGGTSQTGGTTPSGGSGASGGLNDLSLVYVDSRNGTPQLFVSKADGSNPRRSSTSSRAHGRTTCAAPFCWPAVGTNSCSSTCETAKR